MRRWRNLLLAMGLVALMAIPHTGFAAEEPKVDLMQFIPEQFRADFVDRNGDGIPDLGTIPPEGVAGIWDDKVGEVTDEGFLAAVEGVTIDAGDKGSSLTGPCKGVVIAYDSSGMSVDAMFDRGGPGPLLDVYGDQKMTKSNPLKVDTRGVLVYFGSSQPDTFHNHQWFLKAAGIFKDNGGDPNQDDKNRNAGSVDFASLLPFSFTALVEADGAWVDQYGAKELPEMSREAYPTPNCVGHGWVQFVGPFPLATPVGMISLLLAAAGFTGVLFNARPALSWKE